MTITTSTSPQSPAQPLTFPALPFAKLAPCSFLSAHLSQPINPVRPSGRAPSQTRPPAINTGSLAHAHGSAVVRQGDNAVVCGVRGEVLRVEDIADWDPSRDEAVLEESISTAADEDEKTDDGDGDGDEVMQEKGQEEGHRPSHQSKSRQRRHRQRKQERDLLARLNLLVPNIELATGCNPSHLPGGPPSALAQTVTQRLLTSLHTSDVIRLSDLVIWGRSPLESSTDGGAEGAEAAEEGEEEADGMDISKTVGEKKRKVKAFWTLYIDIVVLSLSGPPLDMAWLTMLAALRDTRLPHVWWDGERDIIACVEPFPGQSARLNTDSTVTAAVGSGQVTRRQGGGLQEDQSHVKMLRLREIPIALSFGLFQEDGSGGTVEARRRKWVLVDPDGFEEGLCAEMGTVVVGDNGRLFRVEKEGGGGLGLMEFKGILEIGEDWRKQCINILEESWK